jgi:hypothetical protein
MNFTLQQMRELANRKTGLVPMRVQRSFAPYHKGAIAGFPPETALDHLQNGVATLHGIDAPGEFNPVGIERPADPQNRPNVEGKAAAGKLTAADIPADWRDMHYLQRMKLAVDLGWQKPPKESLADGEKITDLADAFIEKLESPEGAPVQASEEQQQAKQPT